jgi:1,4-dihydroxy-2-naphthoyl-CoA hydrolase
VPETATAPPSATSSTTPSTAPATASTTPPTPAATPAAAASALPSPAVQRGPLELRMGFELAEATPERAVGSIPVEGNAQLFGVLHGGASCVLAESLASTAACLHFAPRGVAVGTEISATHHRPARAGRITGTATAVHLGRTHATYEIAVHDDDGKRVCTARMTCVLAPS